MNTFSVIIPVFNCKAYLRECLASLIAVNDPGKAAGIHEIILVDDGSTDGSSALCDELASENSTEACVIRTIHQTNQGVSSARNTGLRAARGTFVFFVDSDDTVESQTLAELLQRLSEDTDADMAVFGLSFDYYTGDRLYRRDVLLPPVEGTRSLGECSGMTALLFRQNMLSSLCNRLIRRSVIEEAGIFLREDMFLYEDLEFSLRTLARCKAVLFYREPIYRYRQTPDQGNAGRRLKRVAHVPEIVDKIEDALLPSGGNAELLLSLYLILAREKIRVATVKETKLVCADFKGWIDRHGWKQKIAGSKQAMLLYEGETFQLLFRREKTKVHHFLAVRAKRFIGSLRKS